MRTFVRILISIVAGYLLMWPLGFAYTTLSWPTFHSWGLSHGAYIAAWPTLSLLAFLALGYLPLFRRIDDAPLLIAGLAWGLLLASFFNIRNALGFEITYGLLGGMAIGVAALCCFARQPLRLALAALVPVVLLTPELPPTSLSRATSDLKQLLPPFAFVLAGYALGSLARLLIRRSPRMGAPS